MWTKRTLDYGRTWRIAERSGRKKWSSLWTACAYNE